MMSVITTSDRLSLRGGHAAGAQQRSAARGSCTARAGQALMEIARTFGMPHTTISRL
jgi:hypothetical protein